MRRLQILRGQLQYKPELKDGEFFLDKTNHSLLIGDAAVADGQFELAKQSAITNLQQQVDTKITAAQAPVQSVNTKTGAVVLTAADVGALPDTTSIPTKTSEIENDSGFITAAQAPVQSVDGATGVIMTNAVKYTAQTLTDDQKTQARTNIGAGTSSFSGSYDDLSNKPTIPSTAADVGAVPTTRTVNGKALSADITLSASDVGALPDTTVIPTVPVYSLTKDATSADYAAVYHLTKDGTNVGEPINIPKDLFVESGEIVDNPTGYPEGKYIKLTLQNQTEPIYINVADLVDAYTAGNGITISNNNVVSANVVAGNGLSVDADGIKMAAASGTSAGAMSSADFTKLNGIETGAQKNTVTSVNGSTGAVTIAIPTKVTDLTDAADYATVTSVNAVADDVEMLNSEVGTLTTDVNTLKTNITSKQNTITGGASTITDDNLTTNRALVSNGSGKVAVSDITATELGYLDGVTSNIQTQIDANKIPENDVILKQEAKTSNITSNVWYIAYNNTENKFVTLGYDNSTGDRKAAHSDDGFNWTIKDLSVSQSILLTAIAYGNNTFVAVNAGTSAAYSTDGINWSITNTLSYGSRWSIAFGNNKFVTVSGNSQTATYSTDGINWTDSTLPSSANWISVAYGNGKFVAVARESNKAAYSTDGITWTAGTMPSSGWWTSVTYGNGKFVAIGLGGIAAYSTDGINWIGTNAPNYNFSFVIYGNTNFVAYTNDSNNKAAYSTDGINWIEISLPTDTNGDIGSASYTDNKFIAISQSGKMLYSTDGITWTDTISINALVNPSNTDITESVYNTLSPYIPTPTVPTKTSELTNDSGFITQTAGDARYLQLSGGYLTGAITLLSDGQITSKYGDTAIMTSGHDIGIGSVSDNKALMGVDGANKKLYLGYGTTASVYLGYLLAGKVNFTPTNGGDIVSKKYVDQYAPHATLVTLTVAGWDSTAKTQTVTVSGILADESKQLIIVMPATASMTAYSDAGIQCTGQAANSLTFTAETVPTAAISVYVTYQTVIS